MFGQIKMVITLVLIAGIAGAGMYVMKLRSDNAILKANQQKLETAITEQNKVLEQQNRSRMRAVPILLLFEMRCTANLYPTPCLPRVCTWFFAASPIRRSESVNATYDGVVRLPWSFAMMSTVSFFQTPTHE